VELRKLGSFGSKNSSGLILRPTVTGLNHNFLMSPPVFIRKPSVQLSPPETSEIKETGHSACQSESPDKRGKLNLGAQA